MLNVATVKKTIAIILGLTLLVSCDFFSGVIHDGKVVAQAGSHKLYSTDLERFIPSGLSAADSTRLAMQYINSWAADQLYLDVAEKELSKAELDVTDELEDYRRSLLKYRYEQAYVNQRLDTAVTRSQVEDYFEAHKQQFVLRVPVLKVRLMSFSPDSPSYPEFRKKVTSKKPSDLADADSLAYTASLRYTDYGGSWVDAVTLAREFGTDYMSMLSHLKDGLLEMDGPSGNKEIAIVDDFMAAGQTGPLEYYSPHIKDIILGARKQALLSSLETDLVSRARANNEFVIY